MIEIKKPNYLIEGRTYCYSCGRNDRETYCVEIDMDMGGLHNREYFCEVCLKELKEKICREVNK